MRLKGQQKFRVTRLEREHKEATRFWRDIQHREYQKIYRNLENSMRMYSREKNRKINPIIIMLMMGHVVYASRYLGRNWRKRRRVTR